jgi:hypothetical protein
MKSSLVLLFFLIGFNHLYSQQINTETITVADVIAESWIGYYENEQFKISFKKQLCDPEMGYDNESILLKVENKSGSRLKLQWHNELYFGGECKTCDYLEEYTKIIQLDPMSSIEGTCSIYTLAALKIFVRFADENYTKGEVLSTFRLNNLNYTVD